jgi:hypothetical protein
VKCNSDTIKYIHEKNFTVEIYLEAFKKNPSLEKFYYNSFQKHLQKEVQERCRALKQELLAEAMKPSRIQSWIDCDGFDGIDCY